MTFLVAVLGLLLTGLLPAHAAVVNCTPEAGFTKCKRYSPASPAADQSFTVPAGITQLKIKLWGAGGGGGSYPAADSGLGGGGGFAVGNLLVVSGNMFTVVVGQAGSSSSTVSTYGGGGAGGNDSSAGHFIGGSGGGRSAIRSGSTELMTAAGGGGSAGATANNSGSKGAQSFAGAGGQDASWFLGCVVGSAATAGTTTVGGTRGSGAPSRVGTDGSALAGGNGGPASGSLTGAGGGGGGGFFGGGGGAAQNSSGTCSTTGVNSTIGQEGGGGGGSSFLASTVTGGSTVAGSNAVPAQNTDTHYVAGTGVGGTISPVGTKGPGGDGEVVIQWAEPPTLTLSKISMNGTGSFVFNGAGSNANGFPTDGSYSITTVTPGSAVTGSKIILTAANVNTDIKENLPADWTMTGVSCVDANAAVSGNPGGIIGPQILDATTFRLPAGIVKIGADFQCAVTNNLGGPTLKGRVFQDNGIGSGTAHNGTVDGMETGLSGVVVQALSGSTVVATTVTAGDGSYTLILPIGGGAVSIVAQPPSGYLAISENVGNTGATNPSVTDSTITFTATGGSTYSGVNFGEVRLPAFAPDQLRSVAPGTAVFLPHTFTVTTSGTVEFSVPTSSAVASPNIPGWSTQLFRDSNCNGSFDSGEPALSSALTLDADSNSQICILLKVVAPAGVPVNSQLQAKVQALMSYASSSLTSTLTVNDTVTVADGSTLVLTKAVNKSEALPGEIVTYTLSYRNPSAQPMATLMIYDSTPTYTTYVGGSADCVMPLPMTVTSCTISKQPSDGGTGVVEWALSGNLQSGAEGQVQFKVKIQQ